MMNKASFRATALVLCLALAGTYTLAGCARAPVEDPDIQEQVQESVIAEPEQPIEEPPELVEEERDLPLNLPLPPDSAFSIYFETTNMYSYRIDEQIPITEYGQMYIPRFEELGFHVWIDQWDEAYISFFVSQDQDQEPIAQVFTEHEGEINILVIE